MFIGAYKTSNIFLGSRKPQEEDKVDFKTVFVTRDKECYYIMKNGSKKILISMKKI